jgi:hypothetical protein
MPKARKYPLLYPHALPWAACLLQDALDRIVPEGSHYRHLDEGYDDMPAHVKVRVNDIMTCPQPLCCSQQVQIVAVLQVCRDGRPQYRYVCLLQ